MLDEVKSLRRFGREQTAAGNGWYYFDVDSDGVTNILSWIKANVEATHIILQYQQISKIIINARIYNV